MKKARKATHEIIPQLVPVPVDPSQLHGALVPQLNLDYGDSVVRYVNEALRRPQLLGPVTDPMNATAFHTLHYLANTSKDPITLTITTLGGDIMDGFSIHDLILDLRRKAPIDILASGACMSMGVIILQAARRRLSYPHTHFMLHELQGQNQGDLGELRDRHRHMLAIQKRLNELLSKRTGLSVQKIAKLIERKDCYINAQEAKQLGLIDEII